MKIVRTITRGSSSRPDDVDGPDSRRFYPPVDVMADENNGQVFLRPQSGEIGLTFWPEEATALADALNEATGRPQADEAYLVAWSGGYEAPSYMFFRDETKACDIAREWMVTASEEDVVDVLRIDLRTLGIERLEISEAS